jgi:ribosome-binding protein aMBF1 (putative translation factor)
MATRFKTFFREIEEGAAADGPAAVADLQLTRTRLRLGRQIASGRRAKRLSLSELASRAALDEHQVAAIERGDANPSLSQLEALGGVVGCSWSSGVREGSRQRRACLGGDQAADPASPLEVVGAM